MRSSTAFLFLLGSLLVAACNAPVGAGGLAVPSDSAQTCAQQCHDVGMGLDSMVMIAGQVGCVCRPAGSPPASNAATGAGASASAGGAAALIVAESQRQQTHH